MKDIGFTHVALSITNADASVSFYKKYANMSIVHEREDEESGKRVLWLSDKTRPFVLVLIEDESAEPILLPNAHIGIGCASREEVDELSELARREGCLVKPPVDSGYPVGYWAFLRDPDGHSLEIAFGQEVGLTVEASIEQP